MALLPPTRQQNSSYFPLLQDGLRRWIGHSKLLQGEKLGVGGWWQTKENWCARSRCRQPVSSLQMKSRWNPRRPACNINRMLILPAVIISTLLKFQKIRAHILQLEVKQNLMEDTVELVNETKRVFLKRYMQWSRICSQVCHWMLKLKRMSI